MSTFYMPIHDGETFGSLGARAAELSTKNTRLDEGAEVPDDILAVVKAQAETIRQQAEALQTHEARVAAAEADDVYAKKTQLEKEARKHADILAAQATAMQAQAEMVASVAAQLEKANRKVAEIETSTKQTGQRKRRCSEPSP
jgi:chromosome segregation ATPase